MPVPTVTSGGLTPESAKAKEKCIFSKVWFCDTNFAALHLFHKTNLTRASPCTPNPTHMETTPSEKDNRTHQINCRVTAAEYAQVSERATSIGLSKTDYVRQLVLGHVPRERFDVSTRRNLAGIGNNLNQFVARINVGMDERELVMEVVREIKALLAQQ